MNRRQSVLVATALRVLLRIGIVLCLLLAAVALAIGVGEYPGYTRPAFRWLATEVFPLVGVGWINLVALDGPPRRARRVGLLAIVVDLALLIHAGRAVQVGAPPFAFMLAGTAGLLVIGAVLVAAVHDRFEW